MPSTFRSLSPALITRETLAGVLTALALIPEVISFSVIAGVDPQVSLIASVVLCLAMSVLGGRPAMVTAAAGSVALVIGPMVHQHGVGYILPAVILAGIIQILFGIYGMARLMRFIPPPVMTGFVNALGILIFFRPGSPFLEQAAAHRRPFRSDAAHRAVGAAFYQSRAGAAYCYRPPYCLYRHQRAASADRG